MAFNQGPEPAIVLDQNGIRYVDPNPTDQIVNHEDLVMYVKFVARTKGRSILTVSDEETKIDIEQKFVRSNTNFTYPDGKKQIDTEWTNLGGGPLDPGEDIGTFGITNINIDFKSSFMPKIIIDFVDVRGATLFEQGPCSPYSAFFHLPYPVFELTVKGYYGKPVTYTLALIKFNTKFNAETGNFESKGEFIGYTYAFLADIPMGYIMASTYMEQGKNIFPDIWKKYRSIPGLSGTADGIPEKPTTLYDLIKVAKKLETETPKLKNTFEIVDLAGLGKLRNTLKKLRNAIIKIEEEWLKVTVGKSKTAGIKKGGGQNAQKHTLFANIPSTSASASQNVLINSLYDGSLSTKNEGVIYPNLGDGTQTGFDSSKIGTLLSTVKSIYATINGTSLTPPELPLQNIKNNIKGFWGVPPTTEGNLDSYSFDVYAALLKEVDDKLTEVDKSFKTKRDNVKDLLNQKVKGILGFNPSIRNVFAIILANCEVFLEILRQTSIKAEEHHDNNIDEITSKLSNVSKLLELKDTTVSGNGAEESDETVKSRNDNKIYPWPTYYETTSVTANNSPGDKETYPGENIDFTTWPEVQFVEDFIKALTEMRKDLVILEGEFDNLPGFDNFVPLSVLETPILGREEASSRWLNVGRGSEQVTTDGEAIGPIDNLYATIGENAFLVGDYSFINTLTLWKSQLGFDNGWGFETITGGKGGLNGYTSNTVITENYNIGPQTLAQNPSVDTSATNLGRYKGEGMEFTDAMLGEDSSFSYAKVSPTTKDIMKRYGYIDALNCLSTLQGEKDLDSISHLKQVVASTDAKSIIKERIKKVLKQKWANKYKTEKFDDWAKTATSKIGGDKELVTKQNIWDGHYSYVKSSNILTLTGPIPNSVSEANKDYLFSSNPYMNPKSGVSLMSEQDFPQRTIEFNEETTPRTLIQSYAAKYGIGEDSVTTTTTNTNTEENEKAVESFDFEGISSENAIIKKLNARRPKIKEIKSGEVNYPYVGRIIKTDDDKTQLTINEKTQLLESKGEFVNRLYYRSYKDSGNGKYTGENQIIWDLGSSRTVYEKTQTVWNDFVGPSASNKIEGAYDPYVQTPLWTLNYPIYKAPSLGNAKIIAEYEIINKDTDRTKEDTELKSTDPEVNFTLAVDGFKVNGREGQKNEDERWANNPSKNFTRNFATWWGLNSWGTRRGNDDYVLPLAYIFILSMGFDNHKRQGHQLGHYFPNDGASFQQQSPFSNFSLHPGIFGMPRSFILLIGAILWRAKEGGILKWEGKELEPTAGGFDGWNVKNAAVGIDDLGDPVWFFHNCISKPWQLGGAVVSNNMGKETNPFPGTTGNRNKVFNDGYLRQYIGERKKSGNYIDVWSESGGPRWNNNDPNNGTSTQNGRNFYKNEPMIIGNAIVESEINRAWIANALSSPTNQGFDSSYYNSQKDINFQGWVKSHKAGLDYANIGAGTQRNTAVNRGMFDQCRQDQIPFLVPQFTSIEQRKVSFQNSQRKYYDPATLVITDLQDNSGRKAYFGVPSPEASISAGFNTTAPNREAENQYIKLKENCKELMLLPKELKNEFINEFVTWAKEEYSGKGKVKYLHIVDPINWTPTYGLGNDEVNMYGLLSNSNAIGTFPQVWGNIELNRGLNGFVDPTYRENLKGKKSGWFYGKTDDDKDAKVANPWFQAYSTDSNIKRVNKYTPPQSNASSSYSTTTCFVKGTRVSMANGSYKNIENIIEGDEVLSYNTITNEFGVDTVSMLPKTLGNYQKIIAIYEDGTKNEFSPAHPFYIEGKGWASYDLTDKLIIGKIEGAPTWGSMFKEGNLHQLEVGDYCVNNKGQKLKITSLDETNEYVDMYNLEHLNNNKTWFANEVLVKE